MAKKAGNGEGSLYQRKNGSWVAAISIGHGPNGKPKRRTLYAHKLKNTHAVVADVMGRLGESDG